MKRNLTISGAVMLKNFRLDSARRGLVLEKESPAELLKELKAVEGVPDTDCSNFRRGSVKVKEHLIAATALLYDARISGNDKSSVLCCSRCGSHQQNLDYFQDYVDFGRVSGRGHLFVATIPTTPMCEAAISIGAHGPAYYLDTADDFDMFYDDAELLLEEDGEIPGVAAFFDFPDCLYGIYFTRGTSEWEKNIHPGKLFEMTAPELSSCVVIPVYNNSSTVRDVVERSLRVTQNVLVIDDGSTDADLRLLLADTGAEVVRHEHNQGKGAALITALKLLSQRNIDYMISLDGDGQHYPEDIPVMLRELGKQEGALLVGCRDFNDPNVPGSSRFGRKFSNFWMGVETGCDVDDCQSGFRAYPVKYVSHLKCLSRFYNFETEILTRSAWANLPVVNVPIRSYYPPQGERISHFRPFVDNFRISCVHTLLVLRRLMPIPHRKLIAPPPFDWKKLAPRNVWKYLVSENSTPGALAAAAGVGTLLAVLPLLGLHGVVILYAAARLHLNKLMAFNIQHIFMPPLTPFLCIELGHYLRHGRFLTEFTMQTLFEQGVSRIAEWLLGSLVLAPVFAVITSGIVYFTALAVQCLRRRARA